MTTVPDDPIDSGEARFARRMRDYTEPAVVPVDHAAVARAAAGAGGPRRSGAGRFGWLFAGAAVLAGLAVMVVLVNGGRTPSIGATSSPAVPTAVGADPCAATALEATVGSWEGAAGHRVGTLTITNRGSAACVLSGAPWPSLIDRNGHDLIVGKIANLQPVRLAAGGTVRTLVQTGNYCGPTAQEPAAVALDFGALGRLIARPVPGDETSGVPPCMGEAGPTDDVTIQDWGAAQG